MSAHQNQLPPRSVNVTLHGDCIERLVAIPADSVAPLPRLRTAMHTQKKGTRILKYQMARSRASQRSEMVYQKVCTFNLAKSVVRSALLSAFSRRSPSVSQVRLASFALRQPQEKEGLR